MKKRSAQRRFFENASRVPFSQVADSTGPLISDFHSICEIRLVAARWKCRIALKLTKWVTSTDGLPSFLAFVNVDMTYYLGGAVAAVFAVLVWRLKVANTAIRTRGSQIDALEMRLASAVDKLKAAEKSKATEKSGGLRLFGTESNSDGVAQKAVEGLVA